jgi:N-acylglucosamine-6-phosphate 2-epimerase
MSERVAGSLLSLKGGLVVSVQADGGDPLDDPAIIAALARTVAVPGCRALRINGPANIRAVRAAVDRPIIGIYKWRAGEGGAGKGAGRVWITPAFEMAQACREAGADVIALDATAVSPRPFGDSVSELISRIHGELGVPVLADVSDLAEGVAAAAAGADMVGSTLAGYVRSPLAGPFDPPDLALVEQLARAVSVPVIAEGRYNTPALARQALDAGAWAVVVGSAITRPALIARSFVEALG